MSMEKNLECLCNCNLQFIVKHVKFQSELTRSLNTFGISERAVAQQVISEGTVAKSGTSEGTVV